MLEVEIFAQAEDTRRYVCAQVCVCVYICTEAHMLEVETCAQAQHTER
jgi:hypothetical protein